MDTFNELFEMQSHKWVAQNGKPTKKKQVRLTHPSVNTADPSQYKKRAQTITKIGVKGDTFEVTYTWGTEREFTWTVPNTAAAKDFFAEVFQTFLEENAELNGDEYVLLPPVTVEVEMEKKARGKFTGEWSWIGVTEI